MWDVGCGRTEGLRYCDLMALWFEPAVVRIELKGQAGSPVRGAAKVHCKVLHQGGELSF